MHLSYLGYYFSLITQSWCYTCSYKQVSTFLIKSIILCLIWFLLRHCTHYLFRDSFCLFFTSWCYDRTFKWKLNWNGQVRHVKCGIYWTLFFVSAPEHSHDPHNTWKLIFPEIVTVFILCIFIIIIFFFVNASCISHFLNHIVFWYRFKNLYSLYFWEVRSKSSILLFLCTKNYYFGPVFEEKIH